MHKKLTGLFAALLLLPVVAEADAPTVYSAKSPAHRAALLELYTSEGCSSCPPAEAWLSSIKGTDFAGRELIPLAFHVTYWDYIGWRDRFADEQYDLRQRELARFKNKRMIYTPQFVLNGSDYRTYNKFARDLGAIATQPATVDLAVDATLSDDRSAMVSISTDITKSKLNDVAIYMAVYEHNLSSQVKDGENEGKLLKHDYVVHKLYGPIIQSKPETQQTFRKAFTLKQGWKIKDTGLAVFAQDPHSGEILQAVSLQFKKQ